MVYYRLYLADSDGPFIGFEEIEAPDHDEAVRLAGHFRGSHPLGLWCGMRKVQSFPVKRATAAASPRSGDFRQEDAGA